MYLEAQTRRRREAVTSRLPRWLSVLFPFSLVGSVLGQGVVPPAPGFQGAPSVPQMGVPVGSAAQMNEQINNQINASQPSGEATPATTTGEPGTPTEGNAEGTTTASVAAAPVESLMQWGLLHVHASANYQFTYNTEIHTGPGASTSTSTHTFAAPLLAQIGPHVSLSYTPSYRIFSERDFHNTLDHYASLSAGIGYGDWSFGLFQTFSRSDEPLIETGGQTSQDNYSTGVSVGYHLNDKMSLQTSGSVDFNFVNGSQTNVFTGITNTPAALANSRNYSGSEWFYYHAYEKLTTGAGFTFGYSDQEGGFRSTSQQYEGSISWRPGEKLSMSLIGGVEDQQFLNTDAPNNVTPIFSAAIGYRVLDHTSFGLFADRSVSASLFEQQISEVTSVGVGFQQRLLGTLQFSTGFSYSVSDYKTTTGPAVIARTDDVYTYTAGLSAPFLKRCNASVFYSYSTDASSVPGFGYSNNQVGATLSWSY